ncbi:esterase [Pseudocitrobacter cyperus]|uniref:Esterase n=1 Tax=Pseudocitrobacter cyperus TaxID=3112843 RepID=A0ABV0HNI3_9ENTR
MIELEMRMLAGNEVLHAFPKGCVEKPLPCIVFYHGFTSSNLVYSYFAVALAQAGFRVVMPSAAEHGSRFHGDEQERLQHFWQILLQNFNEFPALQDALYQERLINDGRLAVAGASMGGMTALGIMTRHPELKCVASLMGSGYFSSLSTTLFPPAAEQRGPLATPLAGWDVSQQLARVADRPLLLWHGDADDVVPPGETFRLQQALKREGLDANLTCIWQAGVRHRITPEALASTVAFFKQHL